MYLNLKEGDKYTWFGAVDPKIYTVESINNNGTIKGRDEEGKPHWTSQTDPLTMPVFMAV